MNIQPKKKTEVQLNGTKNLSSSWMFPYKENIDEEFQSRYDKIKSEFDELTSEISWNKILYDKDMCQINITPKVNGIYHLYQRNNNKFFLSIIPPNQWNQNYIASFKFIYTGKWIKQ